MSGSIVLNGKQAFTDANGRPLSGGLVYFYSANTSTPKDTWQDVAETVLNTNPIVLDARGEASIYGNGAYRQVLKDSMSVLIWDQTIPDPDAAINNFLSLIGGTTGASLVGWARAKLTNKIDTVAEALNGRSINIWEFANLAGGYTPTSDPLTWDWRPAAQAAMNTLVPGDELYWPSGFVYKVINATGSGGDIVSQRADAVANGTLYAITCATDGIRLRVDGTIKSTSALDDVFRLSGIRVIADGHGILQGPGIFLDTNPSGSPTPDLIQWYPTLINFTGVDSGSAGLRYLDPPTIGVRLLANRGFAFQNRFSGGPATHGTGTVQFGVYAGTPVGGTSGCMVIENTFGKSAANGASYSGIFSVCANSWICNNGFDGMYEHGVYNYGSRSRILGNSVNGTTIAAGIQVFAQDCVIGWNDVSNCMGGIALENPDRCKVIYNELTIGIQLSGISVRTFIGTSPAAFMEDVDIIGNNVALSSNKQSVIDIIMDHSLRNLNIRENTVKGGAVPGASGRTSAILVRVLPGAGNPGESVNICDNTIRDSDGYAIVIDRIQGWTCYKNEIKNVNGLGTVTIACAAFGTGLGKFKHNTVRDTRGTQLTSQILTATTFDLNASIQAEFNDGINLLTSANPLCQVPSDSQPRFNTINGLPCFGFLTMPNTATAAISAPGVKNTATQVVIEPMGKVAMDQQAGAARIYVASTSPGIINLATSNAGAPGANPVYRWEAYQ